MPLPVFATEAEIPEAFRPEYEEREGKWHPKVVAELELERSKHATLLDETKEAKRLKKIADDAAAESKRLLDAKNAGVPEAELQRLRDEDATKRATDLKPVEEERDTWKARAIKAELTDRVQLLAVEAGVMTDRIKLAMRELSDLSELGDKGGIVWKDADGKVTTMDDKQFFAWFEEKYPLFFEFKGGSGTNTGPSRKGGGDREKSAAPSKQVTEVRSAF